MCRSRNLQYFILYSFSPYSQIGQLLYFVGNGHSPTPIGMSTLYPLFAVLSSVFGIISEYILAERL
nr:MAG TPA: hypothetical protein [Bacteriophage sp.]